MKTPTLIFGASVAFLVSLSVQAQNFTNLNFELANPGSISFSFSVPVSNALPYWSAYIGGVEQADVGYNAFSTGAPEVSLIGPGNGPIDGNYSVLLTGSYSSASISQAGLIASSTESLTFEAQEGTGGGGNGTLSLTVGGQAVPLVVLATEPTYTLYAANLSAWAGEPDEPISFTANSTANSGLNNWELDDITFSTEPVPEPNILALSAIGGLVFGARRWFLRRRAL